MADVVRPCFNEAELEGLSRVLADTNEGLTGTEMTRFLAMTGIAGVDPKNTKWIRLYNAFAYVQKVEHKGNRILSFIYKSMQPTRHIDNMETYRVALRKINIVLAFHGLEFKDDGKFHTMNRVESLSEAEVRARELKEKLNHRNLHPELLNSCRAELLVDNYFHAVLEACKSIASRVRAKTGLMSDGAALIDEAFSGSAPFLIINNFKSETEKSEQKGFVNLSKGLFGTFRNPTAHAAKVEWEISEEDALDLFSMY